MAPLFYQGGMGDTRPGPRPPLRRRKPAHSQAHPAQLLGHLGTLSVGRWRQTGTHLRTAEPSTQSPRDSKDEYAEDLHQEVEQLRRAGNMRCAAKAYEEAAEHFSEALELKPDAAQLLMNRAFCRIMMGDPETADEDLCVALALEPRLPSGHRWRSVARRKCNWLPGALDNMRAAASHAPSDDKKQFALQEIASLEEWIAMQEDSEAAQRAAEACLAREAGAEDMALQAQAQAERNLQQYCADMERRWADEEERLRKRTVEANKEFAKLRRMAGTKEQMQRQFKSVSVDPRTGHVFGTTNSNNGELEKIKIIIASLPRNSGRRSLDTPEEPLAAADSTAVAEATAEIESEPASVARDPLRTPGVFDMGTGVFLGPEQAPAKSGSADELAPAAAAGPATDAGNYDAETISYSSDTSNTVNCLIEETVTLDKPLPTDEQTFGQAAKTGEAAAESLPTAEEQAAHVSASVSPDTGVQADVRSAEADQSAAAEAVQNAPVSASRCQRKQKQPGRLVKLAKQLPIDADPLAATVDSESPGPETRVSAAEKPAGAEGSRVGAKKKHLDAPPSGSSPAAAAIAPDAAAASEGIGTDAVAQHPAELSVAAAAAAQEGAGTPDETVLIGSPAEEPPSDEAAAQSEVATAAAKEDATAEKKGLPEHPQEFTGPSAHPISLAAEEEDAGLEGDAGSSGSEVEAAVAEKTANKSAQGPSKADSNVEATLQEAASKLEAHREHKEGGDAAGDKQSGGIFGTVSNLMGSLLSMGRKESSSPPGSSGTASMVPEIPSSGPASPPEEDGPISGGKVSPTGSMSQDADYPGVVFVKEAHCAIRLGRDVEKQIVSEVMKENELLANVEDPWIAMTIRKNAIETRGLLMKQMEAHFKEARELCDKALAVNPGLSWVYLLRAACFLHLNDNAGAVKAYQHALADGRRSELKGPRAHLHVELIMGAVEWEMHTSKPREEVAIPLLESALELTFSPERTVQALLSLVEAHLHFKNISSAEAYLEKIRNDSTLHEAFLTHATNCQRQRLSEWFKEAGNDLQKQGDWAHAKRMYNISTDLYSRNVKAISNRAYMNLKLGLFKEAMEDATVVICTADDQSLAEKALRRRYQAYMGMGKIQKARNDLADIRHKTPAEREELGYLDIQIARQVAEAGAEADEEGARFEVVQQHRLHRKPGEVNAEARIVVPPEFKWIRDLPAQRPARDKTGGVMPGRSEPFLDYDAEQGCTLEEMKERIARNAAGDEAAEAASSGALGGYEAKPGEASPTCVQTGPYSPSSEDCPETRDSCAGAAGQAPADGSSGSAYCTASPNSPVSDQLDYLAPTAAADEAEGHSRHASSFATSECGSAVSHAQMSPVEWPSEVSDTDDDDISEPLPPGRRRTSTWSFKQEKDDRPGGQPDFPGPSSSKPDAASSSAGTAQLMTEPQLPQLIPRRTPLASGSLPTSIQTQEPFSGDSSPVLRGHSDSSQPRRSAPVGPAREAAEKLPAQPPRRMAGLRNNFLDKSSQGIYSDYQPLYRDPERDTFAQEQKAKECWHRGNKAMQAEKFEEAANNFTEVAKLVSPTDCRFLGVNCFLGQCYIRLNDWDKALAAFELATQLCKPIMDRSTGQHRRQVFDLIDDLFSHHATVLNLKGRKREALEVVNKGLKLNKNAHKCREFRALQLLQHGSEPLVIKDVELLFNAEPPYTAYSDDMRVVLELARQYVDDAMRRADRATVKAARRQKPAASKKSGGSAKSGASSAAAATAAKPTAAVVCEAIEKAVHKLKRVAAVKKAKEEQEELRWEQLQQRQHGRKFGVMDFS